MKFHFSWFIVSMFFSLYSRFDNSIKASGDTADIGMSFGCHNLLLANLAGSSTTFCNITSISWQYFRLLIERHIHVRLQRKWHVQNHLNVTHATTDLNQPYS